MTRRRSSAPGRDRSVRHRSPSFLLLAVLAALVVACGGSAATASPGDGSAEPSGAEPTSSLVAPTTGDASSEPSEAPSDSAEASDEPTDTPEPSASEGASETPSSEPTASSGTAVACAGNADNRDFYDSVAAAMSWTVYCPVLPSGWFVDAGAYRLAGGGRMVIGYKGPGGKHIELSEGNFCADTNGCVPGGSAVGDAAFGDQTGSLISTSDGGWAIVVARGEQPSWLLVGSGMDEDAFRTIAGDLEVVPG